MGSERMGVQGALARGFEKGFSWVLRGRGLNRGA